MSDLVETTAELVECEQVIEQGIQTFVEVGRALMRIHHGKLYREAGFKTFEDYCTRRWSFTANYARRMISASEVARTLKTMPIGVLLPKSESQVRLLTRLEPPQQRAVWERAVNGANGHQPTARQVHAAAAVANIDPARIRPISPAPASEEQQHQIAEAEKDSATLFHLKFYWRKAGKGDRGRFCAWIEEN